MSILLFSFCKSFTQFRLNHKIITKSNTTTSKNMSVRPSIPRFSHPQTKNSNTNPTKQESQKNILSWADKSGEFKRQQSSFRNFISKDPGAEFPAEKDRYHLYVSYACPWAHRALIVRKLKGLEGIVGFTSVHWEMLEKGMFWCWSDGVMGRVQKRKS